MNPISIPLRKILNTTERIFNIQLLMTKASLGLGCQGNG